MATLVCPWQLSMIICNGVCLSSSRLSRPDQDGSRIPVTQSLQTHSEAHGDLQRERFHT